MASPSNPAFTESKGSPYTEKEKQEIIDLLNQACLHDPSKPPYAWSAVDGKNDKFRSRKIGYWDESTRFSRIVGVFARGIKVRVGCAWPAYFRGGGTGFSYDDRWFEVKVGDINELRSLLAAFEDVKIRAQKIIEFRETIQTKVYEPRGFLESKTIESILAELDKDTSHDPERVSKREQVRQHLQKLKPLAEEWQETIISSTIFDEVNECRQKLNLPKLVPADFEFEKLERPENEFSDVRWRQIVMSAEIISLFEKLISSTREAKLLCQEFKELNSKPIAAEEKSRESNIVHAIKYYNRLVSILLDMSDITPDQHNSILSRIPEVVRSKFMSLKASFSQKECDLFWNIMRLVGDIADAIRKFNKELPVILGFESASTSASESKSIVTETMPSTELASTQAQFHCETAPPTVLTIWSTPATASPPPSVQQSEAKFAPVR